MIVSDMQSQTPLLPELLVLAWFALIRYAIQTIFNFDPVRDACSLAHITSKPQMRGSFVFSLTLFGLRASVRALGRCAAEATAHHARDLALVTVGRKGERASGHQDEEDDNDAEDDKFLHCWMLTAVVAPCAATTTKVFLQLVGTELVVD